MTRHATCYKCSTRIHWRPQEGDEIVRFVCPTCLEGLDTSENDAHFRQYIRKVRCVGHLQKQRTERISE